MKIWNIMKHDWILSDLLTQMFYLPPALLKNSLLLISAVLTVMKKYIIISLFYSHFKKVIDNFFPFPKNDQ